MVYLLPVFLLGEGVLLGRLLRLIFKKDVRMSLAEDCLIGTCGMLLIWQLFMMPGIKCNLSFSLLCRIYSGVLFVCACVSALIAPGREVRSSKGENNLWIILIAALIFCLQIAFYFAFVPDREGDFTLETVNATLQSGRIYMNHPATGQAFVQDMSFRGKLVTLPLFYAYLCRLVPDASLQVVCRAVPVWILALSYMAYSAWMDVFFSKSDKEGLLRGVGYTIIGLLNIGGSFSGNGIFYYQLHRGYRGETLVYSVLLPFFIYLIYRACSNKKPIWFIYSCVVFLTSFCVVDIQKGAAPLLLGFAVCSLIAIAETIRKKVQK